MAKLKKEILGKVSGSLGDLTFRQRKGKSIISTRPGSFIPGNDPESIARREKFRLLIKLSSTIYSFDELKSIWLNETPDDKTAFNYITQINYPFINDGGLSSFIKLVPSQGFGISNSSVVYNQNVITVTFDALETHIGIDETTEPSVKLISII